MQFLSAVSKSASHSLLRCTSNIQDKNKKQRLESIAQLVQEESDCYEVFGAFKIIHQFPPTQGPLSPAGVTRQEMEDLYKNKFAKVGQPGREIYDEIFGSAPDHLCTLCAIGEVTSLDHYLPQSTHFVLCVAPINLIPVCDKCNFGKRALGVVWLHPHFDNLVRLRWLEAKVIPSTPPRIEYSVRPIPYDVALFNRISNQFVDLEIGSRYSKKASRELRALSHRLPPVFLRDGATGVREHLDREAKEVYSKLNLNCWEAAMYTALAQSKWYCSGGFNF